MKRRLVGILGLAIVVVALVLFGGRWWLQRSLHTRGPASAAIQFHVVAGASLHTVLARLQDLGALHDARMIDLAIRVGGSHPKIRAGSYEIPAHASPAEIMDLLVAGRVLLRSLTVVEGSTFTELRRAIEQRRDILQTLRALDAPELMAALGHPGEQPEGRFFPDTYRFAEGSTDRDVLQLAYRQMNDLLAALWSGRAANLPLRSPYEARTLASVVEKETAQANERAVIAGVFVSRLRQGMRLQSDPTIIYGLGAAYDGDIRTRDLQTDGPYNSYTRDGLPPTPICLPGRAALEATLHPREDGSLFFVAAPDGKGSHVFSRDYASHQAAIRRMLAGQRSRGLIR